MPVTDSRCYTSDPMNAVPPFAMELRHNEEALGRVSGGAIHIDHDEEHCHGEARFWMGLRGLRVALRRPLLPGPRANIVFFIVR